MTSIAELLGAEAESLLTHACGTIQKERLHLPGPDFIDRVVATSDRTPATLRSFQQIFHVVPERIEDFALVSDADSAQVAAKELREGSR